MPIAARSNCPHEVPAAALALMCCSPACPDCTNSQGENRHHSHNRRLRIRLFLRRARLRYMEIALDRFEPSSSVAAWGSITSHSNTSPWQGAEVKSRLPLWWGKGRRRNIFTLATLNSTQWFWWLDPRPSPGAARMQRAQPWPRWALDPVASSSSWHRNEFSRLEPASCSNLIAFSRMSISLHQFGFFSYLRKILLHLI